MPRAFHPLYGFLARHGIYVHDIFERIRGDLRYVNIVILYAIYRQGFVLTEEAREIKRRLDAWHVMGFSPWRAEVFCDE